MAVLLFSNNEKTNFANPVASSDTTATLTSTTGLPNPGAGQYFVMSFFDAATGLITEIVWVTNVTGSVITMERAQEGTTALNWLAGDIAGNFWTAGQAATMQQTPQAQGQAANAAADSGIVNAYIADLSPAPTAHVAGMPIRLLNALHTNTGATTLDVGLGPLAVKGPDGTALVGGEILAGGDYEFLDNSTFYQLSIVTAQATRSGTTAYATDAQTIAGTSAALAVTPHGAAAVTGPLGTAIAAEVTRAEAAEAALLADIEGIFTAGLVPVAWIRFSVSGGVVTTGAAHNCSIARSATGSYTLTTTVAAVAGIWVVNATNAGTPDSQGSGPNGAITAASNYQFRFASLANTAADPTFASIQVF